MKIGDSPSAICYLLSAIRDAKIAAMSFKVEHTFRFDAQGKLDADDWLVIPRAQLRENFVLDAALADEMAQTYFQCVIQKSLLPMTLANDTQSVRYLAPMGKTAMLFAEPERIVDAARAETSWRIAGGFVLAHNANYGGRFYIGAEWHDADTLKLYDTIRRYPPRLLQWFGKELGAQLYPLSQGRLHQQIGEFFLQTIATRVTRG